MPYKKISGIYSISNIITKKCYVGSSYSVNSRMCSHKNLLLKGKHFNKHLQSSYNKHGIQNFLFKEIEECGIDNLIERENFWINKLKSNNRLFGYNVRLDTSTNRGIKASSITREKLRISHLGHKRSKETNEKIRLTQLKSVVQINKNGEKIGEYCSMLEGEKVTKIQRQAISGVCRGINKSAGGYYWCYSENFINFVLPKDLRRKP